MAKQLKVTCAVEFVLPEGVTNLAEALLRLGIRVKQLSTDGQVTPSGSVDAYKGDLTIRNLAMVEV